MQLADRAFFLNHPIMSTISCNAAGLEGCPDININPARFFVRSQNFGELICTDAIPENLFEHLLFGARPTVLCCSSGCVLLQEIETAGLSLRHYTILLTQDDVLFVNSEQPVLSLNFCLRNSFLFCCMEYDKQLSFHEGQFNFSFFKTLNLFGVFQKERRYCFLTLSYPEAYLLKCAGRYTFLNSFLHESRSRQMYFLYPENQFVTKVMKEILSGLLLGTCAEEEVGLLIKKGKMLELLVNVIDRPTEPSNMAIARISSQDVERIYAARDWLTEKVSDAVTLYELARKVGLNVHKLSVGFQRITGMTVFHYHRKIRMAKATQLLESTDRDLFDIGTEVGYSDGKTFSKEFKKEKGLSPLEYRKLIRSRQDAEDLIVAGKL
jgi:AraC family transcriptional activator of pyochelin receptor